MTEVRKKVLYDNDAFLLIEYIPKSRIMETSSSEESLLKTRFLTPSFELPWDLLNELQALPTPSESQKVALHQGLIDLPPLINRTTTRFRRAGIDGKIVAMEELFDSNSVDSTMGASMSLNRQYTSNSKRNKMGTTDNLPFQPGGVGSSAGNKRVVDSTRHLHKDDIGLFDIPNGFTRGLKFSNDDTEDTKIVEIQNKAEDEGEDDGDDDQEPKLDDDVVDSDADHVNFDNEFGNDILDDDDEINDLIPTGSLIRPIRNISSAAAKEKKREWAHVVDLDHKIENFDELVPNPARVWPFQLDTFQQEAIYHLEQGDSVFVAAHTSAGKTVVAEYAISMAHKNMTKAIYTSPIKALSNQKFRDFKHTFDNIDVGVITGDVQINPDANCLIMTTEILRSMLYRGSDVIRDVEFVIFDEVHYVNDVDRGVVWEEVIIMLPEHVKIILLSATVPNTYEFASWVGRTKQKDIYVISTPKRPVPLEVFAFAKDTPYKLISADRKFLEQGFNAHSDRLENKKKIPEQNQQQQVSTRGGRGGSRGGARGGRGGGAGGRGGFANNTKRIITRDGPNSKTWVTLVEFLRKNTLLPAVIFVFSKKRCEEYAETLSGVNFSNSKESSEIHMFIEKAVSRLKKEDRELPQILRMRDMLKRGIAVHHGGLLPIVKEVVEILFAKSLVKVLFATETFAMGLNLPTRTVVFSSIRKHDGTGFRNLLPGEFTQMAGRAGRRGLDKIGTVMVMAYNQPLNKTAFKEVSLGTPTKLSSQFRLTYSMILNLLRIEALRVEEMIKRSFSENSSQSMLPEKQIEVLKLEKKLKSDESVQSIEPSDLQTLESIFNKLNDFKSNYSQMIFSLLGNPLFNKEMKVGKLIVYRDINGQCFPAYITKAGFKAGKLICVKAASMVKKKDNDKKSKDFKKVESFPFHPAFGKDYIEKWCTEWKASGIESISINWDTIEFISGERSHVQIHQIFSDLAMAGELKTCSKNQIKTSYKWKEIDWSRFVGGESMDMILTHNHMQMELREIFFNSPTLKLMETNDNAIKVQQRVQTINKINDLKQTLSDENLELLPQYNKRLDVLKELDYINSENMTINLKGRVACENNSGFELIITELIFDNFLGDFTSEEIVALLSCFIFDGKKGRGEDEPLTPLYTPRLEKGRERICKIVERQLAIATANEIEMTSDESTFLEIDRFALVNTVYEWARGRTFKEIMINANDADESEGTIVRVITFLDEICRQVKNSALIIGDSDLHSKMTDAQEKIKRDIVFCASLYL